MKWDDIAKRLPGRSAISCRLRYQNYSEKRQDWDEEKKNKLARLYNRFKQQMWEMVAKEMGLPWRAIEGIHWEMGREEMASRANVPVFQPHTTSATTQRRSPPGVRSNPNLAPAPTPPGDSAGEQPHASQPVRATRARSTSSGSRRRANARRDPPSQLASVSEGEQKRPSVQDTSPSYVTDIPNTPASSVEWNGSPAFRCSLTSSCSTNRAPPSAICPLAVGSTLHCLHA
ncbi:hypothetical protein, variant [Verruconis gallopava]|uniref:Uncharacterized protein n=1 Tax=Verruconis gallopava TaxID=253628 RepID=A0A0D1XAA5_9PEZI|nr:hypothetical protein, variant [Verruconis gallopava]KIV99110.1 hypothetical protein, variant [Verruconis gallopava]